jgi:hypothetical protein
MEEDLDAFLAAEIAEAGLAHQRAVARAEAAAGPDREALAILLRAQAAHLALLRLIRAALKAPRYLSAIAAAVPPCPG